ncbi:MAG TPA: tetratricopeptide repeat protein [Candidatus Dormibacteraeota bacterium]|nr:tetratricopeptide repeat protein [Candidatus Dormibacteraeota bacterium]
MPLNRAEALEALESGRAEEARPAFVELLRAHPDDPQLNYYAAWAHDSLGLEREAIPFYRRALANGLTGEERASATLGLGSSLRWLGAYDEAIDVLEQGTREFPDDRALKVFLAMAYYNMAREREAMEMVLTELAESSADERIRRYRRAIEHYARDLDAMDGV